MKEKNIFCIYGYLNVSPYIKVGRKSQLFFKHIFSHKKPRQSSECFIEFYKCFINDWKTHMLFTSKIFVFSNFK